MFFNSKLHTGPENCEKPDHGMLIGDLLHVSMTKDGDMNVAKFTAKAHEDFHKANMIVDALRRDLQTNIKVWSIADHGETLMEGRLVKVETISDIAENRLIDEITVTINIPIV
ncbi:hypothetical protein [Siccibacter colletis]|uniref:Uncharacterized protein n=1 Tax=Siccibacter colletis TaxID=1505757 RepID=A0ABY6J8V2_9ENTR|nr:hypothetical protein [Siccibacter colletis]UYU30282.1 hypothetical protein KFZ77_10235 [Siccibacter colletis]